jgi:hypothetical protein
VEDDPAIRLPIPAKSFAGASPKYSPEGLARHNRSHCY